ncbi:MAG: pyridoxamine 5'-phosphate oxidase family protein [Polyangiaceae bacterium]
MNAPMNRTALLTFLRAQRWAVQSSVATNGAPQAAVIGVAITDRFELVFDTLGDTRKAANLRANPRIALVIGWDEGQTVQLEGSTDEPRGDELTRLQAAYLEKFPDGRERMDWPLITYFRVRPSWIRFSDFRGAAPCIVTWEGATLAELLSGAT